MIFFAAVGIGLVPRLGGLPQGFRRLDGRAVDLARRGDAGGSILGLLQVDAADRDPAHAALLEPGRQRRRRAAVRQLVDEPAELVARDAARNRDLLDLALAQVPREADEHGGRSEEPLRVDDDLVADEPDHDGFVAAGGRSATAPSSASTPRRTSGWSGEYSEAPRTAAASRRTSSS